MPIVADCEVVENAEIAPLHYRMIIRAPEMAREAVAGQFCMMQAAGGYDPFLRRPMCFERVHTDSLSILYKIEGEGTRLLAGFLPGQSISIQGPLGKGWPLVKDYDRHIIVSGGIGVAPFPALAEAIIEKWEKAPEVILAARNDSLIMCENEFREMGCTVYLATDDGSAGEKAFASEMLERLSPGPGTCVYACGPMIMMKATTEVALAAGADCLVSLEAQMACGDGACLGCVVESKYESEGEKMVRVCCDGPVFDTTVIDWECHNLAYDV